MGLAIVFSGIGFIGADIWKSGQHHMDGIESMMLTIVILFVIVMWLFSGFACVISKRRSCPNPCIALYGVLLFFIVMLPLFIEGSSF